MGSHMVTPAAADRWDVRIEQAVSEKVRGLRRQVVAYPQNCDWPSLSFLKMETGSVRGRCRHTDYSIVTFLFS